MSTTVEQKQKSEIINPEITKILTQIVKAMIENKAPYFNPFYDDVYGFLDHYDEIEKLLEQKGWKIIEEKIEEGGYWIVPKELEKYIYGIIMATIHGNLSLEEAGRILSKLYSATKGGNGVLIAKFIEDFNIPHTIENESWSSNYTGTYDIALDPQHKIHAKVYYCNDLTDEWGNVYAHGVFKCIDYEIK